ncbi:MAG: alpha-mannosidase [Abditibacteriota bacterium]|nr:alpha-mannosidase [Abditibacteriota bacterium]
MKKVFLICNAHIDPVWQWEWEEGVATAISTFRCAADFCEEFPNFIFCHNESLLYKWIEEYEPALFKRIQKLVKKGSWQIMGGWYLQPDCNMPSGESFVRQILLGREFFSEKFQKEPTTCINFDSFGHSQGLVQILTKAGYDSYVGHRPTYECLKLKNSEADFDWIGFDDSRVRMRKPTSYGQATWGDALPKIKNEIELYKADDVICVLWGVGDHGGGPSRQDIIAINEFIETHKDDIDIKHSCFEEFFKESIKAKPKVKEIKGDLQQFAVGCYTSVIRIKQKHRQLENRLFAVEKMVTHAWLMGLIDYPKAELREACEDLCFIEFHDSLPGSSIEPVEDMCIRKADHGLEILSRLRAKAFFALCAGQPKAKEGQIPIVVYNPHPFKINTQVSCEFMLGGQNWNENEWTVARVFKGNKELPSQNEKEGSTINLDWRKNIVFEAELDPYQINRFDCVLEKKAKKSYETPLKDGKFIFENDSMKCIINSRTGLIDSYSVKGVKYLGANTAELLVMNDNPDPWGMTVDKFRDLCGRFNLMSDDEATAFGGTTGPILPAFRVIEDGPVRIVAEACLKYNNSSAVITYKLPRKGTQIEIDVRIYWNEKDKCLKISFPNIGRGSNCIAQTAYGKYTTKKDGAEVPFQKWSSIVNENNNKAITVINDSTHGLDFTNKDGMRISMLRSAAFCAHPIENRPILPTDRFMPRIDQGERKFKFWLNAGPVEDRLGKVEREADAVSEAPYALSFFPCGDGTKPGEFMNITGDVIKVSAVKKAEKDNDLIVRLFNPTDINQKAIIKIPCINNFKANLKFTKYEIKTLKINTKTGKYIETNLLEK